MQQTPSQIEEEETKEIGSEEENQEDLLGQDSEGQSREGLNVIYSSAWFR